MCNLQFSVTMHYLSVYKRSKFKTLTYIIFFVAFFYVKSLINLLRHILYTIESHQLIQSLHFSMQKHLLISWTKICIKWLKHIIRCIFILFFYVITFLIITVSIDNKINLGNHHSASAKTDTTHHIKHQLHRHK